MLPEFYLQIIEVTKGFLRDEDQKPDLYIEGETPMVENAWSQGRQFEGYSNCANQKQQSPALKQ